MHRRARPRARLMVILCALAPPAAAHAQEKVVKTVGRLEPTLLFDRIEEQLPQSNVSAIVQDAQGFMWFGTQDGVVRHDGYRFRVYRPQGDDPTSLSNKLITALAVDGVGRVWVGTAHGLNAFDPKTGAFKRYLHDAKNGKGLAGEGVKALHVDQRDRLWVALSSGGLQPYDATKDEFGESSIDFGINDIAEDAAGNLWLGTVADGLLMWNPARPDDVEQHRTTQEQNSLADNAVNAVLVTKDGAIWAGTDNGLTRYQPAAGKFTRYQPRAKDFQSLSAPQVTALLEDRGGRLWVCTYSGFNLMNRAKGTFTQFHNSEGDAQSISYDQQTAIYQDRGGVIWIGTWAGGLSKFDELRLAIDTYRTGDAATSFFQEEDGTLWVGTYQRGLYKYERAGRRVTRYTVLGDPASASSVNLGQTWIGALHREKDGTLWIGTQTIGLIGFDPDDESFVQYVAEENNPKALTSNQIWDITPGPEGALWLATWSQEEGKGGLVKFNVKEDEFTTYAKEAADPEGPDNALLTVAVDVASPSILWLGSSDGLIRFDTASDTATTWRHDPANPKSIGAKDVLAIHQEKGGALWIGTSAGLNRFDPTQGIAERFPPESGLPANEVYGVLPDGKGRLWLSTNGRGLLVFDPTEKKVVLSYGISDGIQGKEFAQGGWLLGNGGELFFGGTKGVNRFDPAQLARDEFVPPMALTSFRLLDKEMGGTPIWNLPELELSHGDAQVFTIEFAALSYASPEKNRYRYKLDGLHDWRTTDKPFVDYTNLSGGDYTFRLKAANRHGVWNEKELVLPFHVDPPLYLRWWAFVVYGVLLIGLILAIVWVQRQKLRRLSQETRLKAVERDLELTGAVQSGFLPKANQVERDRFKLFGFYRPADICSGDWWWYEQMAPGHHSIVVGDVTGHGPGPAMVTAAVATAFRVQPSAPIMQRLQVLNDEVLSVGGGKYQMTLSAMEIDESTGQFVFYSAGGLPAINLSADGRCRVVPCRGTPLGTVKFLAGRTEGRLGAGERVLLFTDGIPEIMLPTGKLLGMRRFARMVEATRGVALPDAVQRIVAEADAVRQGERQQDDWTMTIMQWGAR